MSLEVMLVFYDQRRAELKVYTLRSSEKGHLVCDVKLEEK